MRTTLFIPVLNEIDAVRQIMPQIKRDWVDEIIIVDGHSTDGTAEWLQQQGYTVIPQTDAGLGPAYWDCIGAATGDVIIAFSPDGNSVPALIPELVAEMRRGRDIVVASRYLGGAKSEDDDLLTAFGNWLFTKMINVLYGARYSDAIVMYRAFRKDLPARLGLSRGPMLEIELMIRARKHGLDVGEIPGPEPKRIGGIRKMRIWYNGTVVLYAILRELVVHRVRRSSENHV